MKAEVGELGATLEGGLGGAGRAVVVFVGCVTIK